MNQINDLRTILAALALGCDVTQITETMGRALAAFAAHVNIKKVIVVDPDVNVYDPANVAFLPQRPGGPEIFEVKSERQHKFPDIKPAFPPCLCVSVVQP